MFSALPKPNFNLLVTSILSSANAFNLDQSEFFSFGKELTFLNRQILDSSKLKEFVDNKYWFDENDRKFFKPVKTTVEKEEVARYEQFLLFPQCFKNFKTLTADK